MPANYLDDEEDLLPLPEDDEDQLPQAKLSAQGVSPSVQQILGRPQMAQGDPYEVADRKAKIEALTQAIKSKPDAPQPKWYQRLAAGVMGAGAGWVNAGGRTRPIDIQSATRGIMAPGYDRKLDEWRNRVTGAQAASEAANANEQSWLKNWQMRNQEALQNSQERRNDAMAKYEEERNQTALEGKKIADAEKQDALFMKGHESDGIWFDPSTEQAPPGYIIKTSASNPKMSMAIPPRFQKLTEDLAPYAPGRKVGDLIPYSEFGKAQAAANQDTIKNINKPQAEKAKDTFQNIIGTVAGEGLISEDALSNVGKLSQAIKGSRLLTPEQKSQAIAYLATNTTPAATGTAATIRVEGLGQLRELPVIDTHSGNSLMYLSAADINKANKTEPGRYIPATGGTQALTRTALMEDIRGSIGQTRQALAAVPEFTASDKAKIAVALRDRDPRSAVSQLIGGVAGASMTPQQQEYLISLAQLHEQAMAMRSVLGAGQGSDDLRAAILRTIPGPSTPNKAYAAKQLDAFESTLNRLTRGVPKVPLRESPGGGNQGGGGRGNGNPNPTGYVVGHVYGGLTYLGGDVNQPTSWRQ